MFYILKKEIIIITLPGSVFKKSGGQPSPPFFYSGVMVLQKNKFLSIIKK